MDHDMHMKHEGKHEDHMASSHGDHSKMFKKKFFLSLLLTLPVLVYSKFIQQLFHFSAPVFPGSEYILVVFSSAVFFCCGPIFIKGCWSELKNKTPGMMTLISLAIIVSYLYSIATLIFIKGDDFFFELTTLITIMLLGHWLEMSAISKSKKSLDAFLKLLPEKADKLVDGKINHILVKDLQIDDEILVKPGANIPVDGIIIKGTSELDESMVTGESRPITKTLNNVVVAGTTNLDGALTIKVTKVGDDTMLAGIIKLVSDAQKSKSAVQSVANKAALILTIVAIVSSVLAFICWFMIKDSSFALERAVSVLIITCPHALGLAVPLVVSISTTLAARNGILVRNRIALESARNLDLVLFDKTGTLTTGKQSVKQVQAEKGYTKNDILQIAASLEQDSEHTVGEGIVAKAKAEKLVLAQTASFKAIAGKGIEGKLENDDNNYLIVNKNYAQQLGATLPKTTAQDNGTTVFVVANEEIIGTITLSDTVRENSAKAVGKLDRMGVKTAMITGDASGVAKSVAKQVGINDYFADVLPSEKAEKVQILQKNSQAVAMVGDGINDAPALAQADIGIAIGAGTDVALNSADIVLTRNDPLDVVKLINLSKATHRKMVQNLLWATGYNVLAIPLAAGALYSYGVMLPPAVGAIVMSASTLMVALNAQLLRLAKL